MSATRYDFGVTSQKLLLGMRTDQAVAGLAIGIFTILMALAGINLVIVGVLALLGAIAVFAPVRGMPIVLWAAPVTGYLRARRRDPEPLPAHSTASVARAPERGPAGEYPHRPRARLAQPGRLRLPGGLHVDVLDAGPAAHPIGLVSDDGGRSYVAVLRTRGPGAFAILGGEDQAQALDAWGQVLADCCTEDGQVKRIEMLERTVPDASAGALRWASEHIEGGTEDDAADYAALVSAVDDVAKVHEVYLVLRVAPKLKGKDAPQAAIMELRQFMARLSAIGVESEPLAAEEIAGLLRATYAGLPQPAFGGRDPLDACALGAREHWDALRYDDQFWRVFVVSHLPRQEVGPAWLLPLTTAPARGGSRIVTFHFDPIAPSHSRRRVRTAAAAAEGRRRRRKEQGRTGTAEETAEARSIERREQELVMGYRELRVAGLVAVSAPDRAHLDEVARLTTHAAAAAGLELRCAYGQQERAFMAALPLARLGFRISVLGS